MFEPRRAGAGSHNDPNALRTQKTDNRVNRYVTLSADEAHELHRMAFIMRTTNTNVIRAALKLLHTQLTKRGML